MTLDLRTLALVGGGIAAPYLAAPLARTAARAGVPITPFVTDAQRAALAELGAAGYVATVDAAKDQTYHRYGAFVAGHDPMTVHEAFALCEAFLAACHAGVLAQNPLDGTSWKLTTATAAETYGGGVLDAVWQHLDEAAGTELTPLGRAAAQVMASRRALDSGFYTSPADVTAAHKSVGLLAVEMDDLGYLITGAPPTLGDDLAGGAGAAWDAMARFAAERSAAAADALLAALWALVKGSPLLLVGGGLVAWKVLR